MQYNCANSPGSTAHRTLIQYLPELAMPSEVWVSLYARAILGEQCLLPRQYEKGFVGRNV